jgi:hypothetical protein
VELDVGVPSSSVLKILESLDRCWLVLVVICSGIDLGPERASIGVQTGFVGIDPLSTLLLTVIRDLAEDTNLLVAIRIVTLRISLLSGISPGVGVVLVVVAGP